MNKVPREVYAEVVEGYADQIENGAELGPVDRAHAASIIRDSISLYHPKWIRRYDLPNRKHEGWATIVLTEDGMFLAASDYGSYCYYWSHCGCRDFREFLCRHQYTCEDGTPDHYMVSKLNPKTEYDGEATLREVRAHILRQRRRRRLDKRRALEEWQLLEDFDYLCGDLSFHEWCGSTRIDDPWEFSKHRYSASVMAFVSKTMPRLAAILKAELDSIGYFEVKQ